MNNQARLLKRIILIIIPLLVSISFCACQPTPDQSTVNNKNNPSSIDTANSISGNSEELNTPEESLSLNDRVTAQMEYGSNTLIVDAELCVPETIKAPQIRVGLKDFMDGDTLKGFIESIYPDAKTYHDDGVRTPDEISSEIVYVKQLLSIAKENPVVKSENGIIVTYDLSLTGFFVRP